MTSSEEQPAPRGRMDGDGGHRRRPNEAPSPDQRDVTARPDEDGDVAPEHNSLTVGNDPIDKPAESDSR